MCIQDLSLENILMSTGLHDGDYNVQVIDFGMASASERERRAADH